MEIGSTDDGSMEIYSLSFPSPPEFNSQELIFQGIGGSETRSVNYSIQGNGGSDDITNHNTPPSGVVAKFTNSSYKVSGVSQIFDYLARITDSDSEKATIETNFTFSESSFLEDDYGQSLKNQRANKTAALDNRGDPTNYSLDMVCSSGSRVLGGSSSGTLASGESISETIVCEGDWLTISSESSVAKGSDGSYTHTLGTQGIFNTTRLSVSNSRSFTFTGVDISSECSMDTSADVPAGTNTVTSECNNATFTGDWISVSQKSSVKKGSDDSYAHTLDSQGIFNTTSLTVSNSKSFTFSGVDISNECSVDTSADVPAGTNTVTGSCNNNTFTGDWITGVAESLYSQYEASGYSHNTTHQKLVNQTKLMADNARSSTFQDVDISARCSSTTTADVAAGTGVEVTNDCNRNRYVEDWISDGVSGLRQDQSQVSDHNTQYLYKKKWVNETGGYAFSDVTVPSVSMPGTCSNCGTRKPSLSAHENHSEFYNSSGDWIKSEAGYGTEYKSGVVRYGPGVTNDYTATENVQLENTRGDISLAVDVTGPASSVEQCSIKNSSTQVVPAAAKTNFTLFKSCTPGAELEYDPVEKTETQDYFVYNYSATTEVYTDVTDEQSHRYCAPMDRFPNWGSRDPSETTVTVDGSSKDVSVAAESIGGAEYLCITTGDEHTNSSKHDGTHTEAVVYKEKKNTGNIGGGLVGGGGGGSEEELVNVTGQYNWSVSSISSEGDRSFQLFGYPGRSFNIPLTVENTGASNVTIDIECRSSDGSCNWVGPSTDQVKLNAKSFQESIVRIKGKIPENASKERYRFVIRFTDPSYNPENPGAGGYADVDFSISMNRIAGVAFSTWNSFVDVIGKLGEWKEFDLSKVFGDQAGTLSVPFVVLPLIPSVLSFIVMRAASDKGGAVLFLHVVGFIVLFLILTAAVPI